MFNSDWLHSRDGRRLKTNKTDRLGFDARYGRVRSSRASSGQLTFYDGKINRVRIGFVTVYNVSAGQRLGSPERERYL